MATTGQIKSKIQEKRITRSLTEIRDAAKRCMASGAMWFCKSDVVSSMFQIEAKTKEKPSKSITLKKEWFDKIEDEAIAANKVPVVVFSFGDNTDYYAMRDREFYTLMEELIQLRERCGTL